MRKFLISYCKWLPLKVFCYLFPKKYAAEKIVCDIKTECRYFLAIETFERYLNSCESPWKIETCKKYLQLFQTNFKDKGIKSFKMTYCKLKDDIRFKEFLLNKNELTMTNCCAEPDYLISMLEELEVCCNCGATRQITHK